MGFTARGRSSSKTIQQQSCPYWPDQGFLLLPFLLGKVIKSRIIRSPSFFSIEIFQLKKKKLSLWLSKGARRSFERL